VAYGKPTRVSPQRGGVVRFEILQASWIVPNAREMQFAVAD
jgi:hypothetical protein